MNNFIQDVDLLTNFGKKLDSHLTPDSAKTLVVADSVSCLGLNNLVWSYMAHSVIEWTYPLFRFFILRCHSNNVVTAISYTFQTLQNIF